MSMPVWYTQNMWWLILIAAWTLPWKGVALWKAAKQNDQWWFIALLVLNTLAVLEILYIYVFSRRQVRPAALANPPASM